MGTLCVILVFECLVYLICCPLGPPTYELLHSAVYTV